MIEEQVPVRVHVVNQSDELKLAPPGDRPATMGTAALVQNAPVRIVGHTPRRRALLVTIVGTTADIVYLCASQGDASPAASGLLPTGQIVQGTQVLPFTHSDEVWAVLTTATPVSVGYTVEFC